MVAQVMALFLKGKKTNTVSVKKEKLLHVFPFQECFSKVFSQHHAGLYSEGLTLYQTTKF